MMKIGHEDLRKGSVVTIHTDLYRRPKQTGTVVHFATVPEGVTIQTPYGSLHLPKASITKITTVV